MPTPLDALLRRVLAPILGLPPETLCFDRDARGRPFLRYSHAPDFNLSNTRGGTLIAVCATGRVGVDIEHIDRVVPVAKLAARWFAPEEAEILAHLPEESARKSFLYLWTAKEAACKATGTGINGYLSQWCFNFEKLNFEKKDKALQVHTLPSDAGDASQWRFFRLTPSPKHTAVLALRDAPDVSITKYTLHL